VGGTMFTAGTLEQECWPAPQQYYLRKGRETAGCRLCWC
jgi:hypothetical protein